MLSIQSGSLPDAALLVAYRDAGAYTDCWFTDVPAPISHAAFVEAFYTTPVFRIERLILRVAVARPSTDDDARSLAAGNADRFAAWNVEKRAPGQLLLSDFMGRTRSWLMAAPVAGGTRLYFGSAVVPRRGGGMGWSFGALLGFHKLYSQVLLHAARRRLAAHSS